MQDLIEYLTELNPVLKESQYSVDGNWEKAVSISLDNPQDTEITDNIDESVAVEVFYGLSDGRRVFFGLRYSNELQLVNSPAQFLEKILGLMSRAQHVDLGKFINLLGELLNDDPHTYTNKPISHVELGVEGFWKSEGSIVLRKVTDEKLHRETLSNQLMSHPHLRSSTKNYTALEFAINSPESWVGLQVSYKEAGVFKTDLDNLLKLANLI